jgi:hypothetical protein
MTNQKFPTNVQIVHGDFTFLSLEHQVNAVAVALEGKEKETEHNVDEAVLEAENVVAEAEAKVTAAKEAVRVSISISLFQNSPTP